ncbi:glycosyltransferase family 25 protein [Acinetobacter sp. YH12138]|uniref:glycosyltransferase family 25 protein n=1 Tax=Acinetobacter sp. YH12138 TaxID=2601122 RepID=UPI0015D2D8CE|nr:glycosyltransferase family 25 protein [Acinetobacter sp. YH12138]QOW50612.1 glycosyltransferase family 25 protein [Acinetobacter sp. YH12138]
MKVFIISVEHKESPRLKNFLNQSFFQDKAIHYEIIGIKGADLPTKEYFEMAVKGREKPLTPGELGCTLSHLEALKSFLMTNDQYALVLEDDAIIPNALNFDVLEQEIINKKIPSNTLVSLCGIQMKVCKKVRGKIEDFQFLGQKVLNVSPHFFHRVNYAVAYVIDRDMAKTLLNYHLPIRRTDDWSYLFDFDASTKIWMINLIDHPEIKKGESDIYLSRLEYDRSAKKIASKSKYGKFIKKNWAKLFNKLYL